MITSLSADRCRRSTADCESVDHWLARARRGSPAALGKAFDALREELLVSARQTLDARLRSKLGAEDLVQETFVEAQRDFGSFRGNSRREFAAWLRGILSNRCSNSVRHYRLTKRRAIDRELSPEAAAATLARVCDDRQTPGARLLAEDEQRRVRAGLRRMNAELRAVLVEHTCHGATFVEIASRHQCTVKVARTKWARAARQLRRLLHDVA